MWFGSGGKENRNHQQKNSWMDTQCSGAVPGMGAHPGNPVITGGETEASRAVPLLIPLLSSATILQNKNTPTSSEKN